MPDHCGSVGHVTSISMVISSQRRSWRNALRKFILPASIDFIYHSPPELSTVPQIPLSNGSRNATSIWEPMPSPLGILVLQWHDKRVLREAQIRSHEQTHSSPYCPIPTIRLAGVTRLTKGQHRQIIGNETIGRPSIMDQLISVLDQCLLQ
jgi:hypothetical protein